MNPQTLTLHLQGDVPLDLFAQTMGRFAQLIDALCHEVSRDTHIAWTVDDLTAGSATITIAGASEQSDAVLRVSRAYTVVGQSLAEGQPVPYSPTVVRAANELTRVLDGEITALQFQSNGETAVVTSGDSVGQRVGRLAGYGSIEGRIETLTNRQGPGFTLYDSFHDRPVRCELQDDQREMVREAWDHHVLVRGWVSREPETGRPVAIKPVQAIELLEPVVPGSFRRARGILPFREDRPSVEETVRKLRDA